MKIILFTTLSICFIWYLFMGIYIYKIDKQAKTNITFFVLCISTSIWAISYALMLTSPNIEMANIWRITASFGYCLFYGVWLSFSLSFKDRKLSKINSKKEWIIYIPSVVFFAKNIIYKPSETMIKYNYGWVNKYQNSPIEFLNNLYFLFFFIGGLLIIFISGKQSKKNRIKKQTRIIIVTAIMSFILGGITDIILPALNLIFFPLGVVTISIGMAGVWYAINKHRMMSISPQFVSEYIFKAVNEPIFILGEDFHIRNCNLASLNFTGYTSMELIEKPIDIIINYIDYNSSNIIEVGYLGNIEVEVLRKNDDSLICELSKTVIYDEYEDMIGIVILLHDVSERKKLDELQKKHNSELENKIAERTSKLEEANLILKNEIRERQFAEEKIRHFVYFDPLTGLPNRKRILEDINNLINTQGEGFAVLFIDLDNFKDINDNFGHQVGDDILKIAADRFKSVIKQSDSVSRIGGDEFIILLRNLKSLADAAEVAESIREVLSTAFIYKESQLYIGASIGISIYPEHGEDVDTLIRNADIAMYEVKNNGGYSHIFYSSIMKDKAIDRLSMKIKINKAMENNEFIAYYQPIIDLNSMKINNVEALIRWKQGHALIQPMEFISIAKEVGEMVEIDNWMLEVACIQCKKWHDSGREDFCISVNTSYKQLTQSNFTVLVKNILERYSLPAKYLNLEITENEAIENPELIMTVLNELKRIGVKLSLDDFGTGYSSLNYVNKLPIDILKIDRSLIIDLEENPKNMQVIKLIILMAHSLGIKVVAEGIEAKRQFNILKELECDFIQGYLIGKPMRAYELEEKFEFYKGI